MRIDAFSFGSITIDGTTYEHDVVIDGGKIRKRDKKPSKELPSTRGHTPLSAAEDIPWSCRTLVIGTGAYGRLPVLEDVRREAKRRGVSLIVKPTLQAGEYLGRASDGTNAILHVTC
jgi:hypothetical protein